MGQKLPPRAFGDARSHDGLYCTILFIKASPASSAQTIPRFHRYSLAPSFEMCWGKKQEKNFDDPPPPPYHSVDSSIPMPNPPGQNQSCKNQLGHDQAATGGGTDAGT